MKKKLTLEEFIRRARLIHGDRYDYSKVVYINNYTKIIIICPIHGEFEQSPKKHLYGRGCSKCNGGVKYSLNKFISLASKLHKNEQGQPKYSYNYIEEYVNSKTKVPIFCSINNHGIFYQSPSKHLTGEGCPKCGIETTISYTKYNNDIFIQKAIELYNVLEIQYTYIKTRYINSVSKIIVTCVKHGDFKISPASHLQGIGCPRCRESKGETKIANYLDSMKISYSREYKLDSYNYRYDFYLEGYNLLIEFHGIQHYESVPQWDKNRGFKKQQRNDKAKVELAKRNGIDLLVISYLEMEQIEEILKCELIDKVIDTKIVDISHVYGLYCNIDKKEKRRMLRYHYVLYSYLSGKDLYTELYRYKYINKKIGTIIELLDEVINTYKDNFIRLLAIEHKILIKDKRNKKWPI